MDNNHQNNESEQCCLEQIIHIMVDLDTSSLQVEETHVSNTTAFGWEILKKYSFHI